MKHFARALLPLVGLIFASVDTLAHEDSAPLAHYLGNEGVMVAHGNTKVAFDPLFNRDYGQYQLVPDTIKNALMTGTAPFDGLDAVFVSHFHEDHYDPAQMLVFLRAQESVHLYAPQQAIAVLRRLLSDPGDAVLERIHGISLEYGDAPITITLDGLLIEAVRIPHAGWPEQRTEVENIVFRVTLNSETTVSHLGDADADVVHFDEAWWAKRQSHLALPPYWFLTTEKRRATLVPLIHAGHVIGIHVPKNVPHQASLRAAELRDVDLFTRPGETRQISSPAAKPD